MKGINGTQGVNDVGTQGINGTQGGMKGINDVGTIVALVPRE